MKQHEAIERAFLSIGANPSLWNKKHLGCLKNGYSDSVSKRYALVYVLRRRLCTTNENLAAILSISPFTVNKASQFVIGEWHDSLSKRGGEIENYISLIEEELGSELISR